MVQKKIIIEEKDLATLDLTILLHQMVKEEPSGVSTNLTKNLVEALVLWLKYRQDLIILQNKINMKS